MARFINPFTDVGFKRIFGQESNKKGRSNFLYENCSLKKNYLEFSFKCEIFIAMNGNHCYHTSADENRRRLIYLR